MIDTNIDREGTDSVKIESSIDKFGTEDILPLWVADMDIASPLCVQKAIRDRALHPIYGYTIYSDRYYKAIERWIERGFGYRVDRDSIVPSYGVVPSISFAISALSQKGDGVIIQTPIYPPFVASVQKHRRKVLNNRLLYSDGRYSIDFEDFEAKASEAKIFLLCSPHNPTGRVWEKDELERLIEICDRYGVVIVSDEIHSDIVYQKTHYSMASLASDNTILLTAPSKSFNIAGLNSSYAIIPNRKIRKAYTNEQRKAGFSDGNIFGIEALIASYTLADEWIDELRSYLEDNIKLVNRLLVEYKLPIVSTPTEATYLMWLDCNALGLDDKELERFFVYKAKLGLNSGVSFDKLGGSGFMRLNIATDKEVLKEAIGRLNRAYIELNDSRDSESSSE